MTVSQRITAIRAPVMEFKLDEEFEIEVDTEAYGSGENRLLLAIFDELLGGYIGAWATVDPLPPNDYIWSIKFPPLEEWYPVSPIPGILRWLIRVGYMKDTEGVVTDEQSTKVPRIDDRVCNKYYCVGVSRTYPEPREEIAFSGHGFSDWYPWPDSCKGQTLLLLTDEMVVMETKMTEECYYCFLLEAPLMEGGYTYWVRDKDNIAWKSPPIGIWVTKPPVCEDYTKEEECLAHGCYWYSGRCHSEPAPPPPPPPPWWKTHLKELMIASFIGTGAVGAVLIARK